MLFNIKNYMVFLGLALIMQPLFGDPGRHLYPDIKKVNENFYVGKIANRDLWLVAERLSSDNISDWRKYIEVQNNGRVVDITANLLKGFTADGSSHFRRVLNEVNLDKNEVWIGYVTKDAKPRPIASYSLSDYNPERLFSSPHEFAKNIAMYVTVTTSPKALITSHMGVSASFEGVLNKIRGISPDLHSFLAKVMLVRNPERKYMVNAPNMAMEAIIAKSLPEKSVFVGTKEMKNELKKRDITLRQFRTQHEAEIAKKVAQYSISPGENEASRVQRVTRNLYNQYVEPFGYVEVEGYPTLLTWMEKYGPPLLSSDGIKSFKTYFTIYDKANPDKEWLKVYRNTDEAKIYDWMFSGPFSAAGNTHFIVVDLKNLADKGKLE